MNRTLKIINCSDSMMWYSGKIGQEYPLIREVKEGFLTREDAGYVNIVNKFDAIIIDNEDKES